MDQAFAPGESEFDKLARETIKLRRPNGIRDPTTNLLRSSGTLKEFFQELVTSPLRVPRPVPEILLLSHASETGWLEMPLTDEVRNEIQYEGLITIGAELNIPEEVLKDSSGGLRPAIVRIRGCRIGIARPFMVKLKQVLKNVEKLVAPKHSYCAGTWTVGRPGRPGKNDYRPGRREDLS